MSSTYETMNQSTLDDIAELQNLERDLLTILETNTRLSTEERNKIIQNISDISEMRITLYKTLENMNLFTQTSLDNTLYSLQQQVNAISIMEDELDKSRTRLDVLKNEKNNKIRLLEINHYYAEKYAEHSKLLQIIIYALIPIIVLNFIYSYGILPYSIFMGLVILIALIGSYYFWDRFASILMRDNMNYNKYDWKIPPPTDSVLAESSSTGARDPWLSGQVPSTCIGSNCCDTGMTYDYTLDKCKSSPASV